MKRKKGICLLVVFALLVFTAFSGCTVGTSQGGDTVPGETSTTQAKTEDGNLVGNVYKTGLPIVKDKVDISVAFSPHATCRTPFENMEITKEFEERTNVHINFEQIPSGQSAERVNIMIASADLPDVFMRVLTSDILINNYDSGLFLALDDLVADWAPNIKKFVSDPMVKSQITLPDGKIYSTPAGELAPWLEVNQYVYVNKVWLDDLGLKLPTTTDEYKEALIAIRDSDINDGQVIPLSMVGVDNFRMLLGSFGIACEADYIFIRDGKVGYAPVTDNFRDAIDYFHELYEEKLIDSESFAQDIQQLYAKAKSGDVFSFNQFLNTTVAGAELGLDYQHLLPLIGPDGHQEVSQRVLGVNHGFVLSSKTKNPEAIIRFVDYINTDSYTMMESVGGLESQGTWTYLGDERYVQNSNKVPEGTNWIEWYVNLGWSNSSPMYMSPEFISRNRSLEGDEITANALIRAQEVMKYKLDEIMPIAMIDQNVSTELALINTELTMLVRNNVANFIINGIDEKSWNDFMANLKLAKYERYVELKQDIYDKSK